MQFSYSRWQGFGASVVPAVPFVLQLTWLGLLVFPSFLCRKQLAAMVEMLGWSHPGGHLSWGTVKGFSDGSLGSRTALMYEPYLDTSTT